MAAAATGSWEIREGDCIDEMRKLDDASVDAVVCDPPYGLSREPDIAEVLTHWLAGDDYEHRGGGFMGQSWDSFVPGPAVWREALRVLKPGGHVLAFAGSRTVDLMAVAIRMGGFEIRDTLMWIYGSGFPKSLDVSKAIDKRRGDPIEHVGEFVAAAIEASGLSRREIGERFGLDPRGVDLWAPGPNDKSARQRQRIPTWDQWVQLRELLAFGDEMDAEVARLNARKGCPGDAWNEREVIGTVTHARSGGEDWAKRPGSKAAQRDEAVTVSATDEARQWEGWGTALKPAHEPIVVARKPLAGTVAANVLEHGTGGLNIDGCRIEGRERTDYGLANATRSQGATYGEPSADADFDATKGRWPANVALDPSAAALLDDQTGERRGGAFPSERAPSGFGRVGTDGDVRVDLEAGGASRFFYVAKASRAERNTGLEGFDAKALNWSNGEQTPGSFQSEGTDREARNHHPTVKPIELMRWLVRLVTPPGGLVLDPFTGSGTTGCAAVLEGFDFLGLEREAEYVEIAKARVVYWSDPKKAEVALAEARREREAADAIERGEPVQLGLL